ncbi:MAG: hypothetical protein II992_06635 [Lachnospiraceae bacterium]|nr:hypothetical protein [Lachnospiraceae bacterium]
MGIFGDLVSGLASGLEKQKQVYNRKVEETSRNALRRCDEVERKLEKNRYRMSSEQIEEVESKLDTIRANASRHVK